MARRTQQKQRRSRRSRTGHISRDYVHMQNMLTMLGLVARHSGITASEIIEATGLSRASVCRLIARAKEYGVQITFTRFPGGGGEYSIDDWGIFDRKGVLRYLRSRANSRQVAGRLVRQP